MVFAEGLCTGLIVIWEARMKERSRDRLIIFDTFLFEISEGFSYCG
jgi:hypothetical protein